MAKIYNVRSGGDGSVTFGMKQVNSYNVFPTTVVATAGGTTISYNNFQNYDWFNVAQTSAATDSIFLPVATTAVFPNIAAAPIGAEFHVYAISSFAIKIIPASGVLINGVSVVTCTAGSHGVLTRTSATTWTFGMYAANGAFSAPVV